MDTAEARLQKSGIVLPQASQPAGNYANVVRSGNLLFVSGKGPTGMSGEQPRGRLGKEYSVEEGYAYARQAGLEVLAAVRTALSSLDAVRRVVKIQGFINAVPEFEQHPRVLNGCSDLMVEVFGDKGLHARSVFGATSLRANLPIVIDSIFEVR
jgi:enamine deaminase RidA (YjgF/YER057c/UK114 family)